MKRELSILIPTYNYSVYELVKAIHDQASKEELDFEVLVFDDGSEHQIKQNRKISELRNCTHKEFDTNQGRAKIRMRLAEAAKFDNLLFLDSDVLPVSESFISNYIQTIDKEIPVICGGIKYSSERPSEEQMLRYVYGIKRESKSANVRAKEPHIIVTANVLINKEIFQAINTDLSNFYGEDLLLSWNLKKMNISVKHIDNQVYHLGLEDSDNFLEKAKMALRNIVRLEAEGKIGSDFISLQRAYGKLKRFGGLGLFSWFTAKLREKLKTNALSDNPSIFYFNLLRLSYYAEMKKNG